MQNVRPSRVFILLNRPEQISPFVERVYRQSQAEGFIFLETLKGFISEYAEGYLIGDISAVLTARDTLIYFDAYLLPTLIHLKKLDHCRNVFIQHGVFADLKKSVRTGSRLKMISMRSFLILFRWFQEFGFQLNYFIFLFRVFKSGGWSQREFIGRLDVEFDLGIFWVEKDRDDLVATYPKLFGNTTLCLSPDQGCLPQSYRADGAVLYISQPLVEDGLVASSTYLKFLADLQKKYGERLVIVRHPRCKLLKSGVVLGEIDLNMEISKIVGHYSTLLLAAPQNVSIELCDLESATLTSNIEAFTHYVSVSSEENFCRKHFDDVVRNVRG